MHNRILNNAISIAGGFVQQAQHTSLDGRTHHAKEARRLGSGRESQLGSSPLPEPPMYNAYATYKEMLQLVWPNG